MSVIFLSKEMLTEAQIVSRLRALRDNAMIENSQFAVAALIEVKLEQDLYAYVGGVNFENREHNRLSTHAEQNAAAAALTFLGDKVRFSRTWVMGAPVETKAGSKQLAADKLVMPCGHCRQILMSYSSENFEISAVTVNGAISPGERLAKLLPLVFSEDDLSLEKDIKEVETKHEFNKPPFAPFTIQQLGGLLEQALPLREVDILKYLLSLSPHIINPHFQTSPITACLIRVSKPSCYIPGILVQDAAFLTTDAIFTAAGLAVTLCGGKSLEFEELHLLSTTFDVKQLTGSELQLIERFARQDLSVHFYKRDGTSYRSTLSACIEDKAKGSISKLTLSSD